MTASVGEVRAYLRTTARTVLAAHWRETLGREITAVEDLEHIEAQPHTPESEEAISAAPQRVAHVLDRLPDRYRQILELRFLQGSSIKEAATGHPLVKPKNGPKSWVAVNPAEPTRNSRRRPRMSPSRAPAISRTAKARV